MAEEKSGQISADSYENQFRSHTLKIDPGAFHAILIGLKKYEIRYNDRNFNVGDTLYLRETKHPGAEMESNGYEVIYTNRTILKTVSHILRGPIYGLEENWVVMSII